MCKDIWIADNILILKNMALHETTYKKHQMPTEEYCYFIFYFILFYFKIKLQI